MNIFRKNIRNSTNNNYTISVIKDRKAPQDHTMQKTMPRYSFLGAFQSKISHDEMVLNKLNDLKKRGHVFEILCCSENGSKAWGSDSQDSDYDIRFIYVSPKLKYNDPQMPDTLKGEFNEKFDIYGYDLSKIIAEIKKQDYNPYEWVASPKQYVNNKFSNELKSLILKYTDKNNLSKAYKKLSISNCKEMLKAGDAINIKSYLILLKSIIAAEYIDKKNDFPPLTYQELFDFYQGENKEVTELGRNLLKIKKQSCKKAAIPRIPALDKFIQQKIEEYSAQDLTKTPLSQDECQQLDDFFEQTINSPEFSEINKIQTTQDDLERFKLYPKDNDYRKKIMADMGLSADEFLSIKSIVGPQEFKDIIYQFNSTPEVYSNGSNYQMADSKIVNVINGTFRANLHTHTLHSDGAMSVQQLLDSAAKYADKVAKINQNRDTNCKLQPFTIAISDHNTLEGCKEAVDIIRKNPDKYKNLRVVLGCELSTSEKSAGDFKPKKAYQIHLLAQCVNPFDVKTNNELQSRINKNNPCYISIGTMKEAIDILSEQPDTLIGYAHPLEHQSYKKAPSKDKIADIIIKLIESFTLSCTSRTSFVENYYQSYNTELGNNAEIQKAVKKYCDENGILSTGGLDTHGDSIFFR